MAESCCCPLWVLYLVSISLSRTVCFQLLFHSIVSLCILPSLPLGVSLMQVFVHLMMSQLSHRVSFFFPILVYFCLCYFKDLSSKYTFLLLVLFFYWSSKLHLFHWSKFSAPKFLILLNDFYLFVEFLTHITIVFLISLNCISHWVSLESLLWTQFLCIFKMFLMSEYTFRTVVLHR